MNDSAMTKREELLIDRATGDLTTDAEAELEQLLHDDPAVDREIYDRAAGELAAAIQAQELIPMPQYLVTGIVEQGETLVGGQTAGRPTVVRSAEEPSPVREVATTRVGVAGWLGWVAAAAAILVWVLGRGPAESPAMDLAGLRDSLIAADASVLAWSATDDPAAAGASGDVVWSPDGQTGIMRFAGLAVNDRRSIQYQLWIFDSTRDERFPVDGGVFDIPAGAEEVLVAITPKIQVRDAALFAVTVEPPGGVVVSDRERIVLVAQIG